jgi:hypothetical protein
VATATSATSAIRVNATTIVTVLAVAVVTVTTSAISAIRVSAMTIVTALLLRPLRLPPLVVVIPTAASVDVVQVVMGASSS